MIDRCITAKRGGQKCLPLFVLMCIYKFVILVCPHCGTQIPEILQDGLASCTNCHRIFESNTFNRLLSASWLIRKNRYHGIDQLISDTKLAEHEAILVYSLVEDNSYSHEDFQKAIKELGIH
jgi:hypothetical protein